MSDHVARAKALIDLRRLDGAEKELRIALAECPEDSNAHAWLSFVLSDKRQLAEALEEASVAIGINPENDFAFFTLAKINGLCGRLKAAARAIDEALRLVPTEPVYHCVRGEIEFFYANWEAARHAAETGLKFNPRDVACLHLRARALHQLGRRMDALQVLNQALAVDPEFFETHERKGQLSLLMGDIPSAFSHFRESLRLNPNNLEARRGLLEAIKSRNVVYRRLMWLFAGQTGEMRDSWSWRGFLVSFVCAAPFATVAAIYAKEYIKMPSWSIFLFASALFTIGFFSLTLMVLGLFYLLGNSLFVILLTLDPTGRRSLSRREISAATWTFASFFVASAALVGAVWIESRSLYVVACISLLTCTTAALYLRHS